MSNETEDRATERTERDSDTTVANIQRLESGYFAHMQSLRERIPVGQYLVEQQTGRLALVAMAVLALALFVLFPFTMFQGYTYIVVLFYLVAFVAFGWVFYEQVIEPNEKTDTWRD